MVRTYIQAIPQRNAYVQSTPEYSLISLCLHYISVLFSFIVRSGIGQTGQRFAISCMTSVVFLAWAGTYTYITKYRPALGPTQPPI
jgi:hypothetical protein